MTCLLMILVSSSAISGVAVVIGAAGTAMFSYLVCS